MRSHFAVIFSLAFVVSCQAYSFLSCSNYDTTSGECYGYPRKYITYAPTIGHPYDLQADLPPGSNQNIIGVDPLLQNRTVGAPGTAFAAYGAYPLASATPGQNLTLTWPRTADPDGDSVTSPTAFVYYWPNAAANAGTNFSTSVDPDLPTFQQHQLAALPFDNNGSCPVIADSDKFNLAMHCHGVVQVPEELETGIYTFLWYWIINQPTLFRLYPQAFEVLVQQPGELSCAQGIAMPQIATAG